MSKKTEDHIDWTALSEEAWAVREKARILGDTMVGAAALSKNGKIYRGCNIEHQFRSHDIHAEVNAISNMVAGGDQQLLAVLIVAERDRFTPCGACMDWIFEFGGPECRVGFQSKPGSRVEEFKASGLMPHYPF